LSLTRQLKSELISKVESFECCSSWELKAFLTRHGYYSIRNRKHLLSVEVEGSALARYLFGLLKKTGVQSPVILCKQEKRLLKNKYVVQVSGQEQLNALLLYLNLKEAGKHINLLRGNPMLPKRRCCQRAYAKAMFLTGGSISISKRSDYHLEINCGNIEDSLAYQKVLASFSLFPLMRRRKGSVYLYFKSAEAIADYLRIIGGGNTLLDIESMRVVKSVRAKVNRLVNCDTANVEKTVNSAQRQLEVIRQVDSQIGLDSLHHSLREIARIRRENPEASFKELGEMLVPPISKSAVNHRFRKLEKLL